MERLPIRQLARTCLLFGLIAGPLPATASLLVAQEEPRVANRGPLQFGKNYWPSRSATSTSKGTSETQQPGIFRGGLVQQLRSITSSVLGEDASEEVAQEGELDGDRNGESVPTPPSLKDVIDAPAYSEEMEPYDPDLDDQSIPDAPEIESPPAQSKSLPTAPRTSSPPQTPVAKTPIPTMPIPSAPGESRWRNQNQKPLPLNGRSNANLGSPQNRANTPPIVPRNGAINTNKYALPNSGPSNSGSTNSGSTNSGRRPTSTNNTSAVPAPPKNVTVPTVENAGNSPSETLNAKTPAVPQPSKTNSSRRSTTTTDKLNTNEMTLPTTQVTEVDENRIKLSDRATSATSPESAPLVSKKLPPGRPKTGKPPEASSPSSSPALTSTSRESQRPDAKTTDNTPLDSKTAAAEKTEAITTEPSAISIDSSKQQSPSAESIPNATQLTAEAKQDVKADFNNLTPPNEMVPAAPQVKSFDMEIPSVLVRLSGPSDIPVGRKGDYDLIAQNTGTIPLNGAIIRMDIPKGVAYEVDETLKAQLESETLEDGSVAIVWQVSELAPGQLKKLPMKLIAAEARNFAIAMEWTVMPQNGEMLVNVQKPDLQIGLEGPAEVSYGMPQIYRLKISNPGTAAAENVVLNLSAEPYGSNSSPLGTIAPGSNRIVEVELTFQQKGKLKIKAEAVGENLKAASEVDVLVHQALLEAVVSGVENEYVGATVDYKLELNNRGDTLSENVIAQVELPEGVKLTQLPNGSRLSGRILLWEINSLNAGQSLTLAWQAELQTPGEKLFQSTIRGSAGGSTVTQAKTIVEAVADLKLTLSDPPSPSPVGEEVVYELEIVNRGKQSANKVKVLAQFSEGIEPSGAVGAEHKLVPGQVLFEPIPSIPAGETVKLQVRALASEAGVHRFRIEVQTDDEEIHHVLEESTRYMQTASRPTGTKLR